jgi:predicted neutral ceramidase superfamily lipid hydrolase
MKEHFSINIPNKINISPLIKIFICLILSVIIIYPILGITSLQALLSILILFLIIYVILNSISNENLSNELPSTLYPSMPHTGLDGISLNSYVAGLRTDKYV